MIVRIWRTGVDPDRGEEYDAFARDVSAEMFRAQPGWVETLFTRSGERAAVITLWRDEAAVRRLAESPSYLAVVERLTATGMLTGEQSVEVLALRERSAGAGD